MSSTAATPRSVWRSPTRRLVAASVRVQFEQICKCNFANNYTYAFGPRLGSGLPDQHQDRAARRFRCGLQRDQLLLQDRQQRASSGLRSRRNSGQITGLFNDGMPASVRARRGRRSTPRVGQWRRQRHRHARACWTETPAVRRACCSGTSRCSAKSTATSWLMLLMSATVARGGRANGFEPGHVNAISESHAAAATASTTSPVQPESAVAHHVGRRPQRGAALHSRVARHHRAFPYANFPTTQTVRQSLLATTRSTAAAGLAGAAAGQHLV